MKIRIKNKLIGHNCPVFIIAELSGNHMHNFNIAAKSLRAIKECGADAVKLQTYTADTLTIDVKNKYFKIKSGSIWDGKTLYDLYKEAYTPWEWHAKLKKIADQLDLVFLSTPFDSTAVDFLVSLNIPAFKIASFEAIDPKFVSLVASYRIPVIISTGLSDLEDLKNIKSICNKEGNDSLIFLKCTSLYPAPFTEVNLLSIPEMIKTLKTPVGLSDHTLGISVPVASIALGASIIEKHFILDKGIGGPDSAFSLDALEFKSMVKSIREVEQALGNKNIVGKEKYAKSRNFSRSLFAVYNIKKGEKITEKNIRSIRPGYGLNPKYYDKILGRIAKKNIKRGTPINWDLLT